MERTQFSRERSILYRDILQTQIQWKEQVVGVSECGFHNGQQVAYLFPKDRWFENLLPKFRNDILDHLNSRNIKPHEFAHHVLFSQCFALNLAGPFFNNPDLLRPLFGEEVEEVLMIEAEFAGEKNYFNEPGSRGALRTSADLAIWLKRKDGQVDLLLVEVKFTEKEFGICHKGVAHGKECDTDGNAILDSKGKLCPLSGTPYERTYWQLMNLRQLCKYEQFMKLECCPFRYEGYQLMRNQLLAAVIEDDSESNIREARFVTLLHDWNKDILQLGPPFSFGSLKETWQKILINPKKLKL